MIRVLSLLAIAVLAVASEVSSQTVVFENVNVIPMDREHVFERQTVIVRDGRIAQIGPAAGTTAPAGATRVDGTGKYLLPGLAEMHGHLTANYLPDAAKADVLYTPYQALESGTLKVAEYFGTTADTGTVAQGKRADLILLNANPLANIANTENRAGVMVNGRWITESEIQKKLADIAVKAEGM